MGITTSPHKFPYYVVPGFTAAQNAVWARTLWEIMDVTAVTSAGMLPDYDVIVDHNLSVSNSATREYVSFTAAIAAIGVDFQIADSALRVYLRSDGYTGAETVTMPTSIRHLYVRGRYERTRSLTAAQIRGLTFTFNNTGNDLDFYFQDCNISTTGFAGNLVFTQPGTATPANIWLQHCYFGKVLSFSGTWTGSDSRLWAVDSFFQAGPGGADGLRLEYFVGNECVDAASPTFDHGDSGTIVTNNKLSTGTWTFTGNQIAVNCDISGNMCESGALTFALSTCRQLTLIGNQVTAGVLTVTANVVTNVSLGATVYAGANVIGNIAQGLQITVDAFAASSIPGQVTFCGNMDTQAIDDGHGSLQAGQSQIFLNGERVTFNDNNLNLGGTTAPVILSEATGPGFGNPVSYTVQNNHLWSDSTNATLVTVGGNSTSSPHARALISGNEVMFYGSTGTVLTTNQVFLRLRAQIIRWSYYGCIVQAGLEFIDGSADPGPLTGVATNRFDSTVI